MKLGVWHDLTTYNHYRLTTSCHTFTGNIKYQDISLHITSQMFKYNVQNRYLDYVVNSIKYWSWSASLRWFLDAWLSLKPEEDASHWRVKVWEVWMWPAWSTCVHVSPRLASHNDCGRVAGAGTRPPHAARSNARSNLTIQCNPDTGELWLIYGVNCFNFLSLRHGHGALGPPHTCGHVARGTGQGHVAGAEHEWRRSVAGQRPGHGRHQRAHYSGPGLWL